jgi:L-asparaginase
LFLALLSLAALPLAEPPRVHLIATGGTIAGGSQGSLLAQDLTGIPELERVARVSVEDFSSIGSSRMTPELQYRLAVRVREVLDRDPDLSGIVVTHGTDSLEETAFLLDLLIPAGRPVVFAAAMRPPRDVDTDGPRNLLNAVRIAASAGTEGLGVLVTLNDEIHAAREVTKTHAAAVNAFRPEESGAIGRVDSGRVYLFSRPARRLTIATSGVEPRVDLIVLYAGSDGRAVRSAAREGARGIVVDVFGRGNVPPEVMQAVLQARQQGIAIVFTTRTGGGRVELADEALRAGVVSGEDLDALKARVVLVVALGALGTNPSLETLQGYFRQLSGEVLPR